MYNAVIVAVNRSEYASMKEEDFKQLMDGGEGVFVDVKGIFRNKIKDLDYWSL